MRLRCRFDFVPRLFFDVTVVGLITVDTGRSEKRNRGSPVAKDAGWNKSRFLFDWILADVLDRRGPVECVLTEGACSQNCRAAVSGKVFGRPLGGIEIEEPV
jgi:hypothetical protein